MPYADRRAKRAAAKRRARALVVSLLGDRCTRCGETEGVEYDHVTREAFRFKLSKAHDHSRAAVVAEAAKCQALCRPCHLAKGAEVGDHLPRPAPA